MKKLFALLTILICATSFGKNSTTDFATKELSIAQNEYAKALQNIEIKQAQKREELQKIYDSIAEKRKNIFALRREIEEINKLQTKNNFYKNLTSEIRAEIEKLSPEKASNAVSSSEVLEVSKRELIKEYDELKASSSLRQITAIDARTGEKIIGDCLKIGGLTYFLSKTKSGFLSEDYFLYGTEFSQEIQNFVQGKTDVIPVDTSFGKLLKSQKGNVGIIGDIKKGGVWIYPILFLGLLSIIVVLAKIIQLAYVQKIERTQMSVSAQTLKFPYREIAQNIDNATTVETAEDIAFESIARISIKLKKYVSVLNITASVAPLFGLLGTVSGIIKTFADLTTQTEQTKEISSGIAEALITTEYGLIVAIPALIASALVSSRIKKILESATEFATDRISKKK